MLVGQQKLYGVSFVLFMLIFQQGFSQASFMNPIKNSGADPWIIAKDGFYYFTHTTGRNLVLYRTKDFAGLQTEQPSIVWEPPQGTAFSKDVWAPELHFIKGSWYIYFAADDGKNETHRIYVLQNKSKDPLHGKWELKGQVTDDSNKWAIDASVYQYKNKWYMAWSGWEGDVNGQQNIYLARMKNPWTIKGKRVKISSPTFEWERHGDLNDSLNPPHVAVNEGPQFLRNQQQLFIVYSASGCWTEHYGLGLLTFMGKGSLLNASSWTKTPTPVFTTSAKDSVFAPGHNSFFKSPDGKEDWILYHANPAPGMGCGNNRSPRAQKFTWNANGSPNFGTPVKTGIRLPVPSASDGQL